MSDDKKPPEFFDIPAIDVRNDTSDDLVSRLMVGDIHRVHIEALCHQIDAIEETWHAAERKARDALAKLDLWQWMASVAVTVHRNSVLGSPDWYCQDIDGAMIGSGYSPEDAINEARKRCEGDEWKERHERLARKLTQGKGGA